MKRPIIFHVLLGTMLLVAVAAATSNAEQPADSRPLAKATFAGGCFWCMEPPFDKLEGVISTTSGYTGGHKTHPTYQEVSVGGTGHAEAVEIVYDPAKISYARLLEVFWHNIDPTTPNGQFCDKGTQYRSAIFYHDETQKRLAEEAKQALEASKPFTAPIVTEITPASEFYPAEDYHQDYYQKNPIRYKFYRHNCGRDQRLRELWGDPKS
jgi:peptide-methionine (S)-S-oxide reductase